MPVSIWLNNNEKLLNKDQWISLINDIIQKFIEIFGFTLEDVELWGKSFFEYTEGIRIESIPFNKLNEEKSYDSLIDKALKEGLILKITGKMKIPVEEKAFLVCFLRSEDRWDMPHIFFDTEYGSQDLMDILWNDPKKEEYSHLIVEKFHYLKINIFGKEHSIIDHIIVARDFPDNDTLKEPGVMLYYLSGLRYRIIKVLIEEYSSKKTELKEKILPLNMRVLSSKLYDDDYVEEMWNKISKSYEIETKPAGSLALISKTEEGIPILLKNLEHNVIHPLVNAIPPNILEDVIKKMKANIKLDDFKNQSM